MPQQTWRVCRFIAGLLISAWAVSVHLCATISRFLTCLFRRYMCPDPLLPTWCGDVRDVAGKLILDAGGKAQSKCVAQSASSSCPPIPNVAVKAVAKILTINANSAATVAVSGSDNKTMATLDIPATFDSDVSFVISPVSDSVYQAGAFKALFSTGKLRSPLISISPSAIVDTRSGGISLTLSVDVPADQCINTTSNMQVRAPLWNANSNAFATMLCY